MPVTIVNLTKSPKTFNLILPEHRKRQSVERYNYDRRTGARFTHRTRVSLADSITVLALSKCTGLPDTYQREPEIIAAATKRPRPDIKVLFVSEDGSTVTDSSRLSPKPRSPEKTPKPTSPIAAEPRRRKPKPKPAPITPEAPFTVEATSSNPETE